MKKILALVVVLVLGVGLYLFQPWRLWTSTTVNEQFPTNTEQNKQEKSEQKEPKLLKKATFKSLAHETSGEASVYEMPDGKKILRFENLVSSDGPDVKVVITPDKNATTGWEKEKYKNLGASKATHGNINYELPGNISLEEIGSVVLWCERFNESFGVANFK